MAPADYRTYQINYTFVGDPQASFYSVITIDVANATSGTFSGLPVFILSWIFHNDSTIINFSADNQPNFVNFNYDIPQNWNAPVFTDITVNAVAYDLFSDGSNIQAIDSILPLDYVVVNPLVPLVCFLESTQILTSTGYLPINSLKPGDLVQTLSSGLKPIKFIGSREIYHPCIKDRIKDQLYVYDKDHFPQCIEPLIMTGGHSSLVDELTPEQIKNSKKWRKVMVKTEGKYLLLACVDERTRVYEKEGNYQICNLILDDEDKKKNFGIYANGILVESMPEIAKEYLNIKKLEEKKDKSVM